LASIAVKTVPPSLYQKIQSVTTTESQISELLTRLTSLGTSIDNVLPYFEEDLTGVVFIKLLEIFQICKILKFPFLEHWKQMTPIVNFWEISQQRVEIVSSLLDLFAYPNPRYSDIINQITLSLSSIFENKGEALQHVNQWIQLLVDAIDRDINVDSLLSTVLPNIITVALQFPLSQRSTNFHQHIDLI
jgi:hypothetical protein